MSFFDPITAVIDLGDGNKVTVKKMSYGALQDVISKCSRVNFGANNERQTQLDYAQLRVEQLIASIISWEGPGFGNTPVTPANVRALPQSVAEAIEAGINGSFEPISEEEEKNSDAPTNP